MIGVVHNWIKPRHQTHMRGGGRGICGHRLSEEGSLRGKRIEVGRQVATVALGADMVTPQRIERDQKKEKESYQ